MAALSLNPETKPDVADKFVQDVAEARSNLSRAADNALPAHDPFRALTAAIDEMASVLPCFLSRVEQSVDKSRAALSPDQQRALCSDVSSAASIGGANGVRRETRQLVRATNRAMVLGSGVLVGLVGLACGGGGYFVGRMSTQSEVVEIRRDVFISTGSVQTWLDLMRANPSPADAIALAQKWIDQKSKRQAGLVPLYLTSDDSVPGKD